jgi:hypothetical protein
MKRCLFFAALTLAVPGFAQTLKMELVPNPVSGQPAGSLVSDSRGKSAVELIETLKDGSYTLRYSIRRGAQWSEPRTGGASQFFRHPAERRK